MFHLNNKAIWNLAWYGMTGRKTHYEFRSVITPPISDLQKFQQEEENILILAILENLTDNLSYPNYSQLIDPSRRIFE